MTGSDPGSLEPDSGADRSDDGSRAPDAGDVDLTMVVPFYNAGGTLRHTVDELIATLRDSGLRFEVICVSDGSTDGSEQALNTARCAELRIICRPHRGKGGALHVGLARGNGRYVGFIDADGDLPPSQMTTFLPFADGANELVVGTKLDPRSRVTAPVLRRIYSSVWESLATIFFHLTVRDSQTGLKLIRRDVLTEVLPHLVEDGFAFDLELLVVARRLGHTQVVEVPVVMDKGKHSTVSARSALHMAAALLRIYWHLHVTKAYDRPAPRA